VYELFEIAAFDAGVREEFIAFHYVGVVVFAMVKV
jgi:hypothetical protein